MAQVKNLTKVSLQYKIDENDFELLLPVSAPLGQIYDACVAFAHVAREAISRQEAKEKVEEQPPEEEQEEDGGTE